MTFTESFVRATHPNLAKTWTTVIFLAVKLISEVLTGMEEPEKEIDWLMEFNCELLDADGAD